MFRETLRVGLFLGWKQIRRANMWTTGLIVFIMMLTFLNLVVVSGILVGLIEGSVRAFRDQHTGDVFLSTPEGESFIEKSTDVLATLNTIEGIEYYSARATEGATIEANYRTRRDPNEVRDTVSTRIVGINPLDEDKVTNLSRYVESGEYLTPTDQGSILVGANMLEEYAPDFGDVFSTIGGVVPGTRVRVTAHGNTKEFEVKGIIKSKVDETSFRVFMLESDFRQLVGRTNMNVNEVAITVADATTPLAVKSALVGSGIDSQAVVRISREALPQALEDIIVTFEILGNAISSIGLMVSSITVFIVVFINAITRRKYIGILKGIGIKASAIEFSYVFQSLIYVLIGAGIAIIIIYSMLVPLLTAHPIDFPFSDGILVAPLAGTLTRLSIMIVVTLIAGYIPAWLIIKKNTLNSILGR